MPSHNTVAAAVRRHKQTAPMHYCWHPRCLYRTYDAHLATTTPCPKHGVDKRK